MPSAHPTTKRRTGSIGSTTLRSWKTCSSACVRHRAGRRYSASPRGAAVGDGSRGAVTETNAEPLPMTADPSDLLRFSHRPALREATLVLAFTGWMDGGDVSTGTVRRLVDLLEARPVADIDPEPFYVFN